MTEREWMEQVKLAANPPEVPAAHLMRGETVAWVKTFAGINGQPVTCGISELHRHLVDGKTYCGQSIPPTKRRLGPPHGGVEKCQRCEYLHDLGVTPEQAYEYLTRSVA
jgi:hypothetical protein